MTIPNLIAEIQYQIEQLHEAKKALEGILPKHAPITLVTQPLKPKRTVSAKGRKAISIAQKKRWAAKRKSA